MSYSSQICRVAFVGNYLPKKCGIATFTHDMYTSITTEFPGIESFVVAVNDQAEEYDYPAEVRFAIHQEDEESYHRAAEYLNHANPDVVSLQHEYGIFGGPAGSHILSLLRDLQMPVVTTLHTVLQSPSVEQKRTMERICDLSARVVVMSDRGREFLRDIYQVAESKSVVVAHGIPDMPFVDPNYYKDRFNAEGKIVILTFGLLAPNKGIEYMLQALPRVVQEFPDVVYMVLGATHPNLVRDQGEKYRDGLEKMVRELRLEENVRFHNQFVELDELTEFIGASDLYVTPYLNPAQITSGTLAYSFGCGKAVISTPYWHAEELLADDRGVLVPFEDATALASAILDLLKDETRRHGMRKKAYQMGRDMIWPQSARNYMDVFSVSCRERSEQVPHQFETFGIGELPPDLPAWNLDYLWRMTDSTGMLQNAVFTVPNYAGGYSTDDNARALLLTVLLEELGLGDEVADLGNRYAAFLQHALEPESKRFRNRLGYDRHWLEDVGSEDCHGRALWALGTCLGRSKGRHLRSWVVPTFDRVLPPILEMTSPRAWAFALLGIGEYLRRLQGARIAEMARDNLTVRLLELFEQHGDSDWVWFEDELTYDNARISQALIVTGHATGDAQTLTLGLRSLRWLTEQQKAPEGYFQPIGSDGYYPRGETRAKFDQQPLEVTATVSACLAAYQATDDVSWLREAQHCVRLVSRSQ